MANKTLALEVIEEGTTIESGTESFSCCFQSFLYIGWW